MSPAIDLPPAPRAPDRGDLVALFVERVEDYRAVVTRCAPDDLGSVVAEALGAVSGKEIAITGETPVAVAELSRRFESWLPDYMAGSDAA